MWTIVRQEIGYEMVHGRSPSDGSRSAWSTEGGGGGKEIISSPQCLMGSVAYCEVINNQISVGRRGCGENADWASAFSITRVQSLFLLLSLAMRQNDGPPLIVRFPL